MPNAMKLVCAIPCSTFLRRESILLGWVYGVVVTAGQIQHQACYIDISQVGDAVSLGKKCTAEK
jgi:hypothetical protein